MLHGFRRHMYRALYGPPRFVDYRGQVYLHASPDKDSVRESQWFCTEARPSLCLRWRWLTELQTTCDCEGCAPRGERCRLAAADKNSGTEVRAYIVLSSVRRHVDSCFQYIGERSQRKP